MLLFISVCLVTKGLKLVSATFTRMIIFLVFEFSVEQPAMIQLSKEVTNCMLYIAHGLELMVYFKMDKNLWKIFGARRLKLLLFLNLRVEEKPAVELKVVCLFVM